MLVEFSRFATIEASAVQLGQAIAAQGKLGFADALLSCLSAHGIAVDHCSIFTYDDAFRPMHVGTASRTMSAASQEVAAEYAETMFPHDPLRRRLRQSRVREGPAVLQLDPATIRCAKYRNACFRRIGTVDKVCVVTVQGGRRTSLNLYRHETSGSFGGRELRRLRTLAPVFGAMADKHATLAAAAALPARMSAETFRPRIVALGAPLSPREIEVCALILMGHTSESIALNLGVSQSTILTFRKRAYGKLSISSANELFKRVMQSGLHG